MMICLFLYFATSGERNSIKKKNTVVPDCTTNPPTVDLEGCDAAYEAVLAELDSTRRSIDFVSKKNKTVAKKLVSKSKFIKKEITAADLLAAAETFLTQCPLAGCTAGSGELPGCKGLFTTILTTSNVITILADANADFATKCLPVAYDDGSNNGGNNNGGNNDGGNNNGGNNNGGNNDDGDDEDTKGSYGVKGTKVSMILLLIILATGNLIFQN
jgi:hypothetical protein